MIEKHIIFYLLVLIVSLYSLALIFYYYKIFNKLDKDNSIAKIILKKRQRIYQNFKEEYERNYKPNCLFYYYLKGCYYISSLGESFINYLTCNSCNVQSNYLICLNHTVLKFDNLFIIKDRPMVSFYLLITRVCIFIYFCHFLLIDNSVLASSGSLDYQRHLISTSEGSTFSSSFETSSYFLNANNFESFNKFNFSIWIFLLNFIYFFLVSIFSISIFFMFCSKSFDTYNFVFERIGTALSIFYQIIFTNNLFCIILFVLLSSNLDENKFEKEFFYFYNFSFFLIFFEFYINRFPFPSFNYPLTFIPVCIYLFCLFSNLNQNDFKSPYYEILSINQGNVGYYLFLYILVFTIHFLCFVIIFKLHQLRNYIFGYNEDTFYRKLSTLLSDEENLFFHISDNTENNPTNPDYDNHFQTLARSHQIPLTSASYIFPRAPVEAQYINDPVYAANIPSAPAYPFYEPDNNLDLSPMNYNSPDIPIAQVVQESRSPRYYERIQIISL